ncbi:MAG: hypothetical protein AAF602_30665, partial [Myxococcota bacterium]
VEIVSDTWGERWYMRSLGLAVLLPAVASLGYLSRAQRIAGVLAVIWWLFAVGSIFVQGRFFGYHFLPLLPANALLVALAASWITGRLPRIPAALPLATLGLLSVSSLYSRHGGYRALFEVASGERSIEEHYTLDRFDIEGFPIPSQRRLVGYLRAHTEPDDAVLIWGFDPVLHVWAQRRPASRLIYNFPFMLRGTDQAFWLGVLLDDLERTDPAVVVVATEDELGWMTGFDGDSVALLATLPELQKHIESRYAYVGKRGVYHVWHRRPAPQRMSKEGS